MKSVLIDAETRQPTIHRANTSMTNATKTSLLRIAAQVKSDTQS